jgi:F0F1-type ATP synthase assembly protein I
LAGSFAGMSHASLHPHFVECGRTWKDGMAEDDPRQDSKSPQDARLASLDERLRQAQAEEEAARSGTKRHALAKGQAQAGRVLSVLVSYPVGSALIGYALDQLVGTHGIWVAMLFLGFGVAMWEVWKISRQGPQ